jgi:hypothetical protein
LSRTRAVAVALLAALPGFALALPHADVVWTQDAAPAAAAVQSVGGAGGVVLAGGFDGTIWRSTDQGLHWAATNAPSLPRARIAADPFDPSVLYAAGFNGLARSDDGGLTWQLKLAVARAARIDVGPTGLLLIGARYADGSNHVLLSADRGDNFADVGAPLPPLVALCGVAFGRTGDEVLAMTDARSWFSHDAGATWTETAGAAFDFGIEDSGVVWRTSMLGLQVTRDGGATWDSVAAPGVGTAIGARPGGGVWLGSLEGLLRTRDGATWENLGFVEAMFKAHGLFADPADADAVFLTDEVVGVARIAIADGLTSFEGRTAGFPLVPITALGGRTALLLAATPKGTFASRDGGASWAHTGAGLLLASATAAEASFDGSAAWVGGRGSLGEPVIEASRDGGRHWARADVQAGAGVVRAIAADPADPDLALAVVDGDGLYDWLLASADFGPWEQALEAPFALHDVAAQSNLVGTALGAFEAEGAVLLPRGSFGATAVSATEAHAFAAGPLGLWRAPLPLAPLVPWARLDGAITDLAAGPGGEAWVVTDNSGLLRCAADGALGACAAEGPPAAVVAVLPLPARVLAGGPGGLWAAMT